MKRLLLLLSCFLMISTTAMADHIGVYSDATGGNCNLAPGFSTTGTVIHKFATGATGSLFDLTFPAGTSFFSFTSPFLGLPVVQPTGIALGYGQCLTGSIVLGNIVAILAAGTGQVVPESSHPSILYTDCNFVEHAATGAQFYVGQPHPCTVATESSTWGSVKSLYR